MKTFLFIANSDISNALIEQLNPENHRIVVASRTQRLSGPYHYKRLNLNDSECFNDIVDEVSTANLTVINSIGLLHEMHCQPEKSLLQFDSDWFMQSMQVNCMSHIQCLKALSQKMKRQDCVSYIGFSARVGSISDNRLGGWLSYRVSKAALNMALKTVSVEWSFKFRNSCVVGYHPGTVATRLSAPFNHNAPKVFTPQEAAEKLWQFMQTLSVEKNGLLFDWRQQQIMF